MTIAYPIVLNQLIVMISGKTMITATTQDAIIRHLGGMWPVGYSLTTIYSASPVTYADAEEFADLPAYDYIEAHINLI
jgi:hypothetical protein